PAPWRPRRACARVLPRPPSSTPPPYTTLFRSPLPAAQPPHPDPLRGQLVYLFDEDPVQEPHQRGHLIGGPFPVLGGEGVDGEVGDAPGHTGSNHPAEGLNPHLVPFVPGKAPTDGPSPVPIHDDGQVPGQRGGLAVHAGRAHPAPGAPESFPLRNRSGASTTSSRRSA